MHTFSFILEPYSFHLSEKMLVDWHRISITYKKLMRLKAYHQWLKRPWKKCAPMHTVHKKQQVQKRKNLDKRFFFVSYSFIAIYFGTM